MAERIAPGTEVTWTSQSGGYEKTKTGTAVAFIEPDCANWPKSDPYEVYPALKNEPRSHIAFDRYSQNARYLVAVPRIGKAAITDYYAPLAKWLEKTGKGGPHVVHPPRVG